MTTLLPDRVRGRRTRIDVAEVPGGPARVRSRTTGDPALPALRAMILDVGPARATVCLVPDGALLLAGDAVDLEVHVGPGAHLELVEPTGTVAYDMRGGSATWTVRLHLGAGATLIWAGEPFVLAAGASVARHTGALLGREARLLVRETLVVGRHGERCGELVQTWAVTDEDGDVLVEELRLDDTAQRPGVLGGNRVLGSVLALGVDVPADVCPEGRMDLDAGGTVWRRLAPDAHRAVPATAWEAVRHG